MGTLIVKDRSLLDAYQRFKGIWSLHLTFNSLCIKQLEMLREYFHKSKDINRLPYFETRRHNLFNIPVKCRITNALPSKFHEGVEWPRCLTVLFHSLLVGVFVSFFPSIFYSLSFSFVPPILLFLLHFFLLPQKTFSFQHFSPFPLFLPRNLSLPLVIF